MRVKNLSNNQEHEVFTKSGDQLNEWKEEELDISSAAQYKVRKWSNHKQMQKVTKSPAQHWQSQCPQMVLKFESRRNRWFLKGSGGWPIRLFNFFAICKGAKSTIN